ncbi:PDZ domain-containing protein [Streptomyces sp. NPDC091280]|uniref:PDZ domain-containing protein n=1 Tax=Streptomyces sp. NPDC091280 TaxID=3365984 RepID=UPI003813EA8D
MVDDARREDEARLGRPEPVAAQFSVVPASVVTARVFWYARDVSRQATLTTLDLLIALNAVEDGDWQQFFVQAAPPPDAATFLASKESAVAPRELWVDLDVPFRVTEAVGKAFRYGEWAALHESGAESADSELRVSPYDLLYGLLGVDDCDALNHLGGISGMSPASLRGVLSDLAFDGALPELSDRPPPVDGWPTRGESEYGPPWDVSVVECLASAVPTGGAVSTLRFVSAIVRARPELWSALASAGYRLAPPDGHAEREEAWGTRVFRPERRRETLLVTSAMYSALLLGRDLAYFRGDASVTAAHVLYGVLDEPENDGFRWLARPASAAGPRQILADQVFRAALPPRGLVKASPAARRRHDAVAHVVVPAMAVLSTVGSVLAALWRLLVLAAIVAGAWVGYDRLESVVNPPPTAEALTADLPVIRAEVRGEDGARPATFVGRLSGFVRLPADSRAFAPDLGHRFVFATQSPDRAANRSTVILTYRGKSYPAVFHCPGALGQYRLCLAEAVLPKVDMPDTFGWVPWSLTSGAGQPTSGPALVLTSGPRGTAVGKASASLTGVTSTGLPGLTVRATGGASPLSASPVVVPAEGLALRLLGVTAGKAPGTATGTDIGPLPVAPAAELYTYLSGLADTHVTAPTGRADAGLVMAPDRPADSGRPGVDVTKVAVGRAADLAGVLPGDRVTRWDGEKVTEPDQVHRAVGRSAPGESATVELRRGSRTLRVIVRLGYVVASETGGRDAE